MQKIDFVNATHPAINDTNLNLMQDNIETAINAQVSGDTFPLGAMIPFPGGTIPDNYLLCDGSAVSRTTYSLLFNVIGTTYGKGDGSTTFNLPDMRLRTVVGVDTRDSDLNAVGKTYGEKTHTLTQNQLPANIIDTANTGSNTDGYIARAGYTKTGSYNFGGQGQPFNIMQPSMATNYIIKAFQTAGVVAQVVNRQSSGSTNVYSIDYINKMFAFTKTYTYSGSNMTSNNGTVQSYSSITVHTNELGTIAYIEGTVYNNHSTAGSATITLSSVLRPGASKSIFNMLTNYNNAATGENMTIATDGTITMQVYGTAGGNSRHAVMPNLIFLGNWIFN
jgi:microcystin-dependent protein